MNTQNIMVTGRRWFQRTYGNTYFSAVGYVDGDIKATIDFEYGYGDHYIDCIADALERAGHMPGREENQPLWQYCNDHNIKYNYSVSDVERKKDL